MLVLRNFAVCLLFLSTLSGCGTLSDMSTDESHFDGRSLSCRHDVNEEIDRRAIAHTEQNPALAVGVLSADGKMRSRGRGLDRG